MVNQEETSERRVALRERLIAAAERIIAERGYPGLRARELAQEVGCALGAIYNVFPDLDALILAVKARTLDALDAAIADRFAAADWSGETAAADAAVAQRRLLTLAEIYLAFAAAHPRTWRALFEHRSPNDKMPTAYLEQLERILTHIERPLQAIMPQAPPVARRLFSHALFSAVHGIVALGLDEKLGSLPAEHLSWQVRAIVEAAAAGVTDRPALAHL